MQTVIRRRVCWVGAGLLVLAGAVAPMTARGAPSLDSPPERRLSRPILVLESYVGQRPDDADALIAPMLDELDARGLVARPVAVLQRLGGRAPRPGALDDATAAAITAPAETGYAAYSRGQFAEAETMLALALDRIHRNPARLVLDTRNLDATFKILVGLALSQAKRGETGASVATMLELIRTFRSHPITRAQYGPDAAQFYRAVARQVDAMGTGELAITIDDDRAVIFVDGQIRGLGTADLPELMPGVYRVFVQVPGTLGRQYEVPVNANELAELRVDWELDASLRMTPQWVGFLFTTEAERQKQAQFAGALARRWGQLIAVIALAQQPGGAGLTATLYDAAGNAVRSGAIAVDGADEHKLRALARYLADGSPGDGVIVVRDAGRDAARPTSPNEPRSRRADHLLPGLLVGAGAAAVVTGGVLYAIDQDPGPEQAPAYRNTGPTGVAVGAAGLAAIGLGLWLWSGRGGASSSAVPIVAISGCGGFIGWAGAL